MTWGDYPGLSGKSLNAITCILIKGRRREIWKDRKEGSVATEAEWRDVATSQRIMAVITSWRQETYCPLEPLEEAGSCWCSDFSSVKLILDIWPSKLLLQLPQETITFPNLGQTLGTCSFLESLLWSHVPLSTLTSATLWRRADFFLSSTDLGNLVSTVPFWPVENKQEEIKAPQGYSDTKF